MPDQLVLALVAVFLGVAAITGLGAYAVLSRSAPERRRLRNLVVSAVGLGGAGAVTLTDAPDAVARRVTTFVPKSPKEMGRLQRRLTKAGYPGQRAAALYAAAEMVLPVVFGLAAIWYFGLSGGVVFALLAACIGYAVPGFWLSHRTSARQKQIRNGLPDALDLLIVCIEAGSAIDQALVKVSEELALPYPALAAELRLVNTEVRAGKPRLEAFKNFASRTGVDDVRSLVAMLVQTDRFGTSIAHALRTHAAVSRTKRRQRAEERAAKLGVKLVFPLVFFLFPAMYVVVLGPAVIKIIKFLIGG
jgi:tight adherence protein C